MPEADTTYRVLTVYNADTNPARTEFGSLAVVLDHVINLAERAKGMIEHMVELSSSAESARIAMGGLINASGFSSDFNQGLAMSSELMKTMREDAAALSGTYEQMQSIFQTMIPIIHEAGESLMSGEKLAGKVMEFGNTFNIPAEFIGREFRQMMEGRASIRNALFKDISSYMGGMTGKEFNALDMAKKWELVNQALSKFDPMFKAVGETFRAQQSTAESYFNQLVRIGGGALFDGLKGELKKINEWYRAHQTEVDEYVRKIGVELAQKIKSAFEVAKSVFTFLLEHRDVLISIAEAYAAIKLGGELGGGLGLKDFGVKAEGLGATLAKGFGGAVEALMLGAIIGKQLTTWLDGAGPPGAWAKFFHTDQAVAYQKARTDSTIDFARRAADAEERSKQFAGSRHATSQDYRESQERLVKFLSPTLGPLAEEVRKSNAFTSGRGGTGSFDPAAFRAYLTQQGEKPEFAMAQAASIERAMQATNAARLSERIFGRQFADPVKEALEARGKPVSQHVTNIGSMHVNVNNNIYDAEDPARIVVKLTAKALRESLEHPHQSPSVAVYR